MKILYVGSEALPFVSTGGLADVLGALPKAVKRTLGDAGDVRVVIPMYPAIREKFGTQLTRVYEATVPLAWRNQYMGIWTLMQDGVTFYFIDNEYYFNRPFLYGSYDDGERFAFFSKAVLEMMRYLDFYPDIMHANDWQSALSVIYLKRQYGLVDGYKNVKCVYTIHNIGYQGVYGFENLGDLFALSPWDHGIVEYNGDINLTKGAIVCADRVTTVSPRYAEEIQTPYYAEGLHHVLHMYRNKISGIINGIDVSYYDPENDPDIAAHFSAKKPDNKKACKRDLQDICHLPVREDVPLIAMVSRLAAHKGFDLVMRIIDEVVSDDVQFVLLGTGEGNVEQFFVGLQRRYPDKVSVHLAYDKAFSKKIYAGADIFLMPSKSEPCGLSQMIASRYGAVPVVRETGGLYDTIHPYNQYDGSGNGFSFANYNAHEMLYAIRSAISLFREPEKWTKYVMQCMQVDFSWNASAGKYLDIYRSLIS